MLALWRTLGGVRGGGDSGTLGGLKDGLEGKTLVFSVGRGSGKGALPSPAGSQASPGRGNLGRFSIFGSIVISSSSESMK